MPYCERCGKDIIEDSGFCSHCGTPVKVSDVTYRRPRFTMWNFGSILAVLFGGLLILVSVGLMLGGGAIIKVHSNLSESEGFLMSSEVRLQSDTYAIVMQGVNINKSIDARAFDLSDFVTKKLVGRSNDPTKELFMGIATDTDASGYLNSVEYDQVLIDSSWHNRPWDVWFSDSHSTHPGLAPSQVPTDLTFWEASTKGSGTQTLLWEPDKGSFWVVVMNTDGSSDVDFDMQIGAQASILRIIGYGLLIGGFIILGVGGFIFYLVTLRARSSVYRG
jgi:hypothetical protein